MILKSFIANLPFSPAVAGQIGFYTKRLSHEEFTRRIGLVLLMVALLMESLVLVSPPQATIAAGPNNIIFQGITSKQDLLDRYDANNDGNGNQDLQQILAEFGISRDDLANGTKETINSRDQNLKLWSMGRAAYNKPGEYEQPITDSESSVFVRPFWSWDYGSFGTDYEAITGTTSDGRFFAILFNCGNLVFNIDEQETPEEPEGFVQHDCDAIQGWAYDPNDTTQKSDVTVWLKLEGDSDPIKKRLIADADSPTTPIGPGHGFNFDIPDALKSDTKKLEYTVVAHDDDGTANDTKLAKNVQFSNPCLEAPTDKLEENNLPKASLLKKQCRCIEGWAYDADDLSRSVEVRMKLRLDNGSSEESPWQYTSASKAEPTVGVGPNHGYKFDIEDSLFDEWKSEDASTLVTVQVKDAESDEWLNVADDQVLEPDPCLEKETQEEPEYCAFNDTLLASDPTCVECPFEPGLWADSTHCNEPFALIVRSKTARNITQEIDDANGTTADPGDIIEYTLTAQNLGTLPETIDFGESLADVLEYADFVQATSGDFDAEAQFVYWEAVELAADASVTRTLQVQIKDEIPATPASTGDPESFNLKMTNIFGDEKVEIKVQAPTSKQVEMVVKELPNTGARTNVMIMSLTAGATVYMYLRNRQLSRELRMVRSEFNIGVA